jgi:hypothetical protein
VRRRQLALRVSHFPDELNAKNKEILGNESEAFGKSGLATEVVGRRFAPVQNRETVHIMPDLRGTLTLWTSDRFNGL